MFTRHCLEVLWHYSQLTSLFLDLNMPAILDLLFLIYKRPATATQPIIATMAARTGFLFVPLLGYCHSLPAT